MPKLSSEASPLVAAMTEENLQNAVIELARWCGWRVHHVRAARSAQGWRTPLQGDVGFFDLVLSKAGTVIFAELKSEQGRLRPDQVKWGEALSGEEQWSGRAVREVVGGGSVAVVVWRPRDWVSGEIEAVLRDGPGLGLRAS